MVMRHEWTIAQLAEVQIQQRSVFSRSENFAKSDGPLCPILKGLVKVQWFEQNPLELCDLAVAGEDLTSVAPQETFVCYQRSAGSPGVAMCRIGPLEALGLVRGRC